MKKIIVTGCNGQLGRAVNLELKDHTDIEFVNTDVEELDITNIDKVMELAREVKPYAIINCAAHTGVDACEDEWDKAYRINAIGPRNLSIAAREAGAKMVHVSTDYIFGGKASKPYTEFDEPNPQGAYGATKLAGENMVKDFADRYFILRTAWLYGDGKNFVKTMLRLAENNDKVRVVGDQVEVPPVRRSWHRRLPIFYLRKIMELFTPLVKETVPGHSLRKKFSGWQAGKLWLKQSLQKNLEQGPQDRRILYWKIIC